MKNHPLKRFAKLITHGIGIAYCKLASLIRSGNLKLPETTAIFNMSSAHDCPSFMLGLCRAYTKDGRHVCYAKKAETTMFPLVEPFRNAQKEFWLNCTAQDFCWQFLLINSLKITPWDALRFGEAGDFHSQECVDKAEEIATILSGYGIKTYCYTCRSDLDYSKVRNLIVSGTGFKKAVVANVFLMVEDIKDRPKGYGICVGDCRVCKRCMVRGNKTVIKRH